jgi:deoxyribose-phosphate aldolase
MDIRSDKLLQRVVEQAVAELGGKAPEVPPAVDLRLTPAQTAAWIDHTLLKPEASAAEIGQLCAEAVEYGFASVCVNASWVPLCTKLLAGSKSKTCAVVGFALGATLTSVKRFEARAAIAEGAQELDMVIHVGRLKDGDFSYVHDDIAAVVDAGRGYGVPVKTILETALLTYEEKIAACVIAKIAGAAFVKTSTGFNGGGATVEDIALMRRVVGAEMGVKAAGGVRSYPALLAMLAAGATRIGTRAGVQIVQEVSAGAVPPVAVAQEAGY